MTFSNELASIHETTDHIMNEYPFLDLNNNRDMLTIMDGLGRVERWVNSKEPVYKMPNPSNYFNTVNRALLLVKVGEKASARDETGDMSMDVVTQFDIFFSQLKNLEKKMIAYQREMVQEEISGIVHSVPETEFRRQLKTHLLDIIDDKDFMMDIFENFAASDEPNIKDSRYKLEYNIQLQERAGKIFRDLIESL